MTEVYMVVLSRA